MGDFLKEFEQIASKFDPVMLISVGLICVMLGILLSACSPAEHADISLAKETSL